MIRVAVRGGDKICVRYQPTIILKEDQVMTNKRNVFEDIMGNFSGLTIRKVCTVANLKYHKIHKAATAPVPGEVYDPEKINWNAIDKVLTPKEKRELEKINWSEYENGNAVKVEVDYDKFCIGSRWHLRVFGWVTIVYATSTHCVLVLDAEPNIPRSWKFETFIVNGPSAIERAEK